jgi:hypothetical protein
MTVAKAYGEVTWRQVIGGKSRRRGLAMNGKGKGLTAGTDSSYGMGLQTREQVGQVGLVEGDVQGRRDVRQHVGDVTSGPIEQCHM